MNERKRKKTKKIEGEKKSRIKEKQINIEKGKKKHEMNDGL